MQVFVLSVVVAAAGCTKDNPHACAEGDPCTDPARPFCDLDGLVAGVPGACIAVSCTPGDFAACDANRAIQCNAAGDNYDTVLCERGCDPASDGCRLCNPNETACTNGVTATCDASGAVVEMEPCPLGCFESEPRCRDVDPSNGLAQYLDMTRTAPDLVLTGAARASSISGNVTDGDGTPVAVFSILVPAPPGGVPVRVFIVHSATIEDLAFDGPQTQQEIPAAAIVAHGEIRITGVLDLSPAIPRISPGSRLIGQCVGGGGDYDVQNGSDYIAGSGGGGGVAGGGRGGHIDFLNSGGTAGAAAGLSPTIEPLVGGCAGGGGASGGGALQVVSRSVIRLEPDATLNAAGDGGIAEQGVIGGGGAGGSVLLEAPTIVLGGGAIVAANGGSGATGNTSSAGQPGGLTTSPTPSPGCGSKPPALCGLGGVGGAQGGAASNGGDLTYNNASGVLQWAGGGGGSIGRVRLNTRDATYVKASDVTESPAPSTGTLRTR